MLSKKQRKAIKLMFQKPDEEVAAEVGVSIETIAKWRLFKEFQKALAAEERVIRAAAARITSDASLVAAKNLHSLLSKSADGKLSLDTLKASGAFAERGEEAGETLEEIIREVAKGDESGD
ncbi:MAG: hypothetical protein ABFD64_09910 [Armatimonadota bacterium]